MSNKKRGPYIHYTPSSINNLYSSNIYKVIGLFCKSSHFFKQSTFMFIYSKIEILTQSNKFFYVPLGVEQDFPASRDPETEGSSVSRQRAQ